MELSNDRITLEYKTYNMLKAQLEILSSLVEGQNDIIQGRTTTIEETFNRIDKMMHQWTNLILISLTVYKTIKFIRYTFLT